MNELAPFQGVLGWGPFSYLGPKRTTWNLPWVRIEQTSRLPQRTCERKATAITNLVREQNGREPNS